MCFKCYFTDFIIIACMLSVFVILHDRKSDVDNIQVEYLKNNSIEAIKLEDDDLNNIEAFIVAELHGFAKNTTVKYDFLRYLNQSKSVNVNIVEISFSSGYMLNEYLKTGDLKLLDDIFAFYIGSPFYTDEEYQFYQKLHQYNKTVSDAQKISIYGIDIEHSEASALYFYQYYTNELVTSVDSILEKSFTDPILIHLQRNILAQRYFYQTFDFPERDHMMFQNLLSLRTIYDINRFYAQVGAKHGFTKRLNNEYRSFSAYLNHDLVSPYKDRVTSIMLFYKDSSYLVPVVIDTKPYYKIERVKRSYKTNNLDIFSDKLTMISLNKNLSPYTEKLIWYHSYKTYKEDVTTDYYQYIIVLNGSKAASPIDDSLLISEKSLWQKILRKLF